MIDVWRRVVIAAPLAFAATRAVGAVVYPAATATTPIVFPRDHGSHPDFRTEWWYVTALLRDAGGADVGVQITFFRNRPGIAEQSRSRFAPRQLLFAHAAIALPSRGRLAVDQRAAREGLGLADASSRTTDVRIGDWSLSRDANAYVARIAAREFTLDLGFRETQPPLLQGDGGVSRKGPLPAQASRYYSVPQLAARGTLAFGGDVREVAGTAWLDHEWSSDYLAADARGWDWTGVNLDDGGAFMAFRIRDRAGATYWAGGALREASGRSTTFTPGEVRFTTLRTWRSPRTEIDYPVAVQVRAGAFDATLEPLFDDQELDARASVGTVYWEGAVTARRDGRAIGRGYLELTGYGAPLRL
ncbi:MAG: lipocalin-like domain-containing protein [Betaproteobacteria bacterium]